jgi:hypothetical protein
MFVKKSSVVDVVATRGRILSITTVIVAPTAGLANCEIVKMLVPVHITGYAVFHPMAVLSAA